MKTKNNHSVAVYLTPEEYAGFVEKMKAYKCKDIGEFARSILFDRPVVATNQNQTFDNFKEKIIRLRRELKESNNRFNKIIKNIPSPQQHVEFKQWLTINSIEKENLQHKINEIETLLERLNVMIKNNGPLKTN